MHIYIYMHIITICIYYKNYKRLPSDKNQQALKTARSKVQQAARRCANEYWTELSTTIQKAADTGNTRGMYEGIKKALGPVQSKTAPLKSKSEDMITDRGQQLEIWAEHYSDLYCKENTVNPSALDAIECLPVMEELDAKPTVEELSTTIDSLASDKAPGSDGIPPDLVKHCKNSLFSSSARSPLSVLVRRSCTTGYEGRAKIITLYKNKGEKSDCNNYRGISFLCIVGKVFARVILIRLHRLVKKVYPQSQCGFRAERSTVDLIFSLRQLQEKCREQKMALYVAFIDLTKAFDLVSRDGLFKILSKIGCPPKLDNPVKSFHSNIKGTVHFNGRFSAPFDIRSGVKQGCVLSPTLFGLFFAVLLKHGFGTATEGVYLRTRSEGRLFNLARLRAKTKVFEVLIRDMLYADDAAITTHTEQELQILMDRFSRLVRNSDCL